MMGGNSGSHMEDDVKAKLLEAKDIASLANFITSDQCQNIVLMLGAGVSTSAGIPDFRSPGTGLYHNLARLNLPRPEAVFEIGFFRRNPVPFYTLAQELYPGSFRPTITHSFIRLLAKHSLLQMCFTQNIDTLERIAGVPENKIIEAHGSFATQGCIDCSTPFDGAKMKEHIEDKSIPKCGKCSGLVKPDIVFFGEGLPKRFTDAIPTVAHADLLIVMGTSLTVHPFALLADMVTVGTPRVLINLDKVGNFGYKKNDVVLLGKCDDIVKELAEKLGWEEELSKLWKETEKTTTNTDDKKNPTKTKNAQDEVEQLTKAVEESLRVSEKTPAIPPKKKSDPSQSPEPKSEPTKTDKDEPEAVIPAEATTKD